MGLKSTFQKAAKTVVKAFGDVPEAASLFKAASDQPAYNPVTSSPATAGASYTITQVVYDRFNSSDIDNEKILPTDEIAMIPSLNISVIPEPDDIITKANASEWKIIRMLPTDPAKALWLCQIRQGR